MVCALSSSFWLCQKTDEENWGQKSALREGEAIWAIPMYGNNTFQKGASLIMNSVAAKGMQKYFSWNNLCYIFLSYSCALPWTAKLPRGRQNISPFHVSALFLHNSTAERWLRWFLSPYFSLGVFIFRADSFHVRGWIRKSDNLTVGICRNVVSKVDSIQSVQIARASELCFTFETHIL